MDNPGMEYCKDKSIKIKDVSYKITEDTKGKTGKATLKTAGKSGSIPDTITYKNRKFKATEIGESAFKKKTVTKVVIGKYVTTIGKNAFCKCTALKSVMLDTYVAKIGASAFEGCKNLSKVTIKTTKLTSQNVGSNVFRSINAKAVIKVPAKKLEAYKKLLKTKGITGKNQKITK